jgi:Raf kinase inhibitor-like YbhB/YbcL family protein
VKQSALPREAAHGLNDWDRTGWGGPCPPIGRHRYYFRLYALDTVLDSARKLNREQLEAAMRSHILATAELMGTYQKGK